MLLSIQGGSDLGLFEINEAARLVQEAAHPEANIIFGAVIDDALGDEVRVTVIAAGFDGGGPVKRDDDRALGQIAGSHAARSRRSEQPRSRASAGAAAVRAAPAPPVQQRSPRQQPRAPSPAGAERSQVQQQAAAEPQQRPSRPRQHEPVPRPPRTVTFDDDDDLDVPGLPEVAAPARVRGGPPIRLAAPDGVPTGTCR